MYVILTGYVRIFITTGNRTLTLTRLKKGDFFGEMALLEKLPRSASAEAITKVELIELGSEDFKFLIQQHPDIAMKVLGKFSARLRDADHLIELLLLGDETGCILQELVKLAFIQYGPDKKMPSEWLLPITIQELSDKANVSVEKTKKVIQELDRIGIANTSEDGILIRKKGKLRYYLEYLGWKSKG